MKAVPKYYCLLVLIFCTQCLVSLAQNFNLQFNHLNTSNGLPSGHIMAMLEDSEGYIWLATENELCRYDGLQVKTYPTGTTDKNSISGNTVYALLENKQTKKIYIFTDRALNEFSYFTGSFKTVYTYNYLDDGLSIYFPFWVNDTTIYIPRKNDCILFNTQTKKAAITDFLNAAELYFDFTKSNIFVVNNSTEKGLHIIEKTGSETKSKYYFKGLVKGNQAIPHVNIVQENDSTLWEIDSQELTLLHLNSNIVEKFPTSGKTLCTNAFVQHKQFFLVAGADGLWLFNKQGKKYTQHFKHNAFNTTSLASDNLIGQVYLDSKNNFWAEVFGKGIDYTNLYRQKFETHFTTQQANGKDNFIRCLAADKKENSWAGAMNGDVYVFNSNKEIIETHHLDKNGNKFSTSNFIFTDKEQNIWLLQNKLYKYSSAVKKFEVIINASKSFSYMLQTATNEYMLSTDEGVLYLYNPIKNRLQTLPQKNITVGRGCFYVDVMQRLWATDISGKINVYANILAATPVKTIDTKLTLKHFFEPKNDSIIWIATSIGLLRINKINFNYSMLTTENGLPNNLLYSVLPDSLGNLWLSSNKGISKFDLKHYSPVATKNLFKNFSLKDALQGNEFNTNGFAVKQNGEMWFSGTNGINTFYPWAISNNTIEPVIHITNISINDSVYTKQNFDNISSIELQPSENNITFNFTAIDFSDAAGVSFKYQLINADKNEIIAANPATARYINLKPGKYKFIIKAFNGDGLMSKQIKQIDILILTTFYNTWWFYLIIFMALIAIVYSYVWLRLKQLKQVQKIRNSIANDLHDDIGSTLSTISLYSEVAKLKVNQQQSIDVNVLLEKIKQASQQMQDNMYDIVWSLHQRNDNVESIVQRLKIFAAENAETRNINFTVSLPDNANEIKLNSIQRKEIFFILKEALNNALKYAQASNISLVVNANKEGLKFSIIDDGIGFDKTKQYTSNGMYAMNERAKTIKAELHIISDKGVRVEVIIPAKFSS